MLSSKLRVMLWLYAGKEIIMENKKPSIEEIFKNGVTVDYELYKSDYANIKEDDIYDKYKSMSNKIDEFLDINKDVSEEYLKLFLKEISKSDYYNEYINKYHNNKILFFDKMIESIIDILKEKNNVRFIIFKFILIIAADMYFKLIKLLDDYNVDISKPINIKVQNQQQNQATTNVNPQLIPMIIDPQDEEDAKSFTSHLSELLGIEKNENGQADFQKIEKRINLLLEKEKHYMKIVEYMKDYRENIENF